MYLHSRKLFIASFTLLLTINSAWANLLIAPTKVVFEERERAKTVNLVNISTTTNTYRLHWNEQEQLPNGQYQTLGSDDKKSFIASQMLRFSPRQVTLAPGQRQTVRIVLRRAKDLQNFDYRSHLVFQALPNEDEDNDDGTGGSQIRLKVNLGFSIPIIVRQGKYNSSVKIDDVEMVEAKIDGKQVYGAGVTLSRSGVNSVYGSLTVFWKDKTSKEYKQVSTLNNVAIYPELPSRQIHISFDDIKSKSGMIKIVYEGSDDLKGKVADSYERKVSATEYKAYNP